MYTELAYVPRTYRRVKKYEFSLSIKTHVSPYHVKTEMIFSSVAVTTHIYGFKFELNKYVV